MYVAIANVKRNKFYFIVFKTFLNSSINAFFNLVFLSNVFDVTDDRLAGISMSETRLAETIVKLVI